MELGRLQVLVGAILLGATSATPHAQPTTVETAAPQQVAAACRAPGAKVLTFAGYSGAGYENVDRMLAEAAAILDRHDPKTTVVNIGATADGLARCTRSPEKGIPYDGHRVVAGSRP